MNAPLPPPNAASSLQELLVVIAVLGVLIAISTPIFTNLGVGAGAVAAGETVERINRAVNLHEQTTGNLSVVPDDESNADELAIIALLQSSDPTARPGSPYLDPAFSLPSESSEAHFRAIWDGEYFRLLWPGQAGPGVRVLEQ